MSDFETAPPLEKGDKVAIVAPSAGYAEMFPHVYELGLKRLEENFGLNPVEFDTATKSDDYLKNNPKKRAEDIIEAFERDDIRGIIATIGGTDQIRILKHLDASKIQDNPTRFYGISDNTHLSLFLWNQGIISYYGGQLMNHLAMQGSMHDYTVKYLEKAFFDESMGEISPSETWTDEDLDWGDPKNLEKHRQMEENSGWEWLNKGERSYGRTWGGCFEILRQQFMTGKYLPEPEEFNNTTLIIETSEELPDSEQIERFFMCLGERSILEKLSGVLIGRPKTRSQFKTQSQKEREEYRENQKKNIEEQVTKYNEKANIVFNVDFGHTDPIVPIPIGEKVKIDPFEEKIVFE